MSCPLEQPHRYCRDCGARELLGDLIRMDGYWLCPLCFTDQQEELEYNENDLEWMQDEVLGIMDAEDEEQGR